MRGRRAPFVIGTDRDREDGEKARDKKDRDYLQHAKPFTEHWVPQVLRLVQNAATDTNFLPLHWVPRPPHSLVTVSTAGSYWTTP